MLGKKKKKSGLALGSGGTKGMAHLGALKAFEEEGISFDLVAGTSIGSIVGGLYACGVSVREMLEILRRFDFTDPQMLFMMSLGGTPVESVLYKITGGKEFDETIIPFKAVAVDKDEGKVEVFERGSLARAMAASSAILPVFRPVEIGGKYYIDGAYLNAVPADVCKDMGADFVLSVNLSGEQRMNSATKPTLDRLYPNNKVPYFDRLKYMYDYSDYILSPDLTAYKSMNVSSMDDMYDIGYEIAKEKMPEIKLAMKEKGIKIK